METRNEQAVLAASHYAPSPQGSILTYGLVSMALFGVVLWGMARFYDVPLLPHIAALSVGLIVALGFGIWLRVRRKTRHREAYDIELDRLRVQAEP